MKLNVENTMIVSCSDDARPIFSSAALHGSRRYAILSISGGATNWKLASNNSHCAQMGGDSMELPKRKRNRLEGYDYSSSGAYFVTICIADRRALFWKNVGANCVRPQEMPPLSDIGKTVDAEIQKMNSVYENVVIDKYCIMPDHIHLIILILSDEDGRSKIAPTLSRIVQQFKGSITKQIGFSIWQKSFDDRIIRNEKGYQEICQYIDENPLAWEIDRFY